MSTLIPNQLADGEVLERLPLAAFWQGLDAHGGPALSVAIDYGDVEVALIDLRGDVRPLLALIHRFRATADPGLILVGLLPAGIDPSARFYLGAVVDVVIEAPHCSTSLKAATLKAAIIDAIEDDFTTGACTTGACMAATLPSVRH